jgi:hypothetical protein
MVVEIVEALKRYNVTSSKRKETLAFDPRFNASTL